MRHLVTLLQVATTVGYLALSLSVGYLAMDAVYTLREEAAEQQPALNVSGPLTAHTLYIAVRTGGLTLDQEAN